MKILKSVLILAAFLFSCSALADVKELFWDDLVPADYEIQDAPISHDGSMIQMNLNAPVVPELNGKKVKIPGFIVPLEMAEQKTTEFLLVPYFGACIHVPPPPPNQIVHIKYPAGLALESLSDPFWIEGKLSTKGWSGDIATVGYSMVASKVSPYDE